jgi:hypothetical protein
MRSKVLPKKLRRSNVTFLNAEQAKLDKDKRMERLRKQMQNTDCVKFSINIPRQIHKKLKAASASEGKDMKSVIMDNILKYLEKFA